MVFAWKRREGLQCPFCIHVSSHRSPTCDIHEAYITEDIEEDIDIVCKDFNNGWMDRDDANDFLEAIVFNDGVTAYDLENKVVVVVNFSPDEQEKQEFIQEYGQYWEGDYNAIVRKYNSDTRTFSIYWTDDNEYAGEMTALELYQYAEYGHDVDVLKYLDQFP